MRSKFLSPFKRAKKYYKTWKIKEGTELGSLESLRTKISRLHEHLISGDTRIKDAKKKV